jgi:hypothetical protein
VGDAASTSIASQPAGQDSTIPAESEPGPDPSVVGHDPAVLDELCSSIYEAVRTSVDRGDFGALAGDLEGPLRTFGAAWPDADLEAIDGYLGELDVGGTDASAEEPPVDAPGMDPDTGIILTATLLLDRLAQYVLLGSAADPTDVTTDEGREELQAIRMFAEAAADARECKFGGNGLPGTDFSLGLRFDDGQPAWADPHLLNQSGLSLDLEAAVDFPAVLYLVLEKLGGGLRFDTTWFDVSEPPVGAYCVPPSSGEPEEAVQARAITTMNGLTVWLQRATPPPGVFRTSVSIKSWGWQRATQVPGSEPPAIAGGLSIESSFDDFYNAYDDALSETYGEDRSLRVGVTGPMLDFFAGRLGLMSDRFGDSDAFCEFESGM